VIITYGGEVKIIDFGVAKSNTNVQTLTGTIKGKVSYMPPEQVLGRAVDHRADIFSAGVVLWEMLAGRPLFLRNSEAATLYAIMNAPIHPPSKIRPDVPPQLDRIVSRALSRRPAERFETAEQMARALDDFMVSAPRYDARVLAGTVEGLFGSTRAEAKRSIAATRSLTRNISVVMKMRSEVRADLAERLDLVALTQKSGDAPLPRRREPEGSQPPMAVPAEPVDLATLVAAAGPSRSQRRAMVALAGIMLGCIAAGVAYMMSRSEQPEATRHVSSQVVVESTPPGAAVFVGGEPTGLKTPATLTGVTARQVAIRLELPNHAPATATVEVHIGATASTRLVLAPLQGRLILTDLPPNASVFVDDEEYAAGDVIALVAGTHAIRIAVGGRTIIQQSIETAAGDQPWKFGPGKLVRN